MITGATGFVGRRVVAALQAEDCRLVLAVNSLEKVMPSWHTDPHIHLVKTGPIEAASNLDQIFPGVTTVVHLAGLAHVRSTLDSENAFMMANAAATERLTKISADKGVKTFIYISSLSAVARNASTRIVDDSSNDPAPTPYGRSKSKAEQHVFALAAEGCFAVSLRPPLIVGADAPGNWNALQRLAATGLPLPFASIHNRRSFIGVGSLTAAICHLSLNKWSSKYSGGYCIADNELMALPQIVSELRRSMGCAVRQFAFPPSVLAAIARVLNREQVAASLLGDLRVDASRFRATFGFAQKQPLVAAIAESGRQFVGMS